MKNVRTRAQRAAAGESTPGPAEERSAGAAPDVPALLPQLPWQLWVLYINVAVYAACYTMQMPVEPALVKSLSPDPVQCTSRAQRLAPP